MVLILFNFTANEDFYSQLTTIHINIFWNLGRHFFSYWFLNRLLLIDAFWFPKLSKFNLISQRVKVYFIFCTSYFFTHNPRVYITAFSMGEKLAFDIFYCDKYYKIQTTRLKSKIVFFLKDIYVHTTLNISQTWRFDSRCTNEDMTIMNEARSQNVSKKKLIFFANIYSHSMVGCFDQI